MEARDWLKIRKAIRFAILWKKRNTCRTTIGGSKNHDSKCL